MKGRKYQKARGGGWVRGWEEGRKYPPSEELLSKRDRKNETALDNSRRRKEGQKESGRKGRWHFQLHREKEGERRTLDAELTECNISCGKPKRAGLAEAGTKPKESFTSAAAGERQTTRVSSRSMEINPANAAVDWGVHSWKMGPWRAEEVSNPVVLGG